MKGRNTDNTERQEDLAEARRMPSTPRKTKHHKP